MSPTTPTEPTEPSEAARLSKLLWEARTGRPSTTQRDLIARIDAYRAARGWSPNGFGGERS